MWMKPDVAGWKGMSRQQGGNQGAGDTTTGKGEKTLSLSCVVNSVLVARQGDTSGSWKRFRAVGIGGIREIVVEHRTRIRTPSLRAVIARG